MGVELREKKLPSGNISLVLDWYWPGRRGPGGKRGRQEIRATGQVLNGDKKHDKEAQLKAEAMLARARLEFESRNGDASPSQFRSMSFNDYMREIIETKDTLNTRHSWQHAMKHFESFMEGREATFGEINRDMMQRFKNYLLKELDSPNSALSYFARFKTALSEAVGDGRLSSNPALYVSIKGVQTLPVHLTFSEVQKLAKTPCRDRNVRNAFLFGCFSGLRISDIINLTWEQIVDGYILFSQVKTGAPEKMPLSEQAKEILEAQRQVNSEGRVFILPTVPAIDSALLTWAKAAGIKKRISSHKARHTFATLALESGVDLYTVSKLLGHKDIKSTQIYAKVTDTKKAEAVLRLPRIDINPKDEKNL